MILELIIDRDRKFEPHGDKLLFQKIGDHDPANTLRF